MVGHREDGPRYVYFPIRPTHKTRDDALVHVVQTYFRGSTEQAMNALLRLSDTKLSDTELGRLREKIRHTRLSEGERS